MNFWQDTEYRDLKWTIISSSEWKPNVEVYKIACQKACNAPKDDSRTTNDTIANLIWKSIKNTSNVVTKVANGMWRDTTQAGWLGLSVTLTHVFCVRALQCREGMLCSQNHLLCRPIRNFLSISIYEDTHSRGGRLKTMGLSQIVLFYIYYTWFSITMSNYYQRWLLKLPQVFIDAYTGSVASEQVKIVLHSHKKSQHLKLIIIIFNCSLTHLMLDVLINFVRFIQKSSICINSYEMKESP